MCPVQGLAAGRVTSGTVDHSPSGLGLVDAESGISWPSGVVDADFPVFLDRLGKMFSTLPSAADATVDLDEDQISKDAKFVSNFGDEGRSGTVGDDTAGGDSFIETDCVGNGWI